MPVLPGPPSEQPSRANAVLGRAVASVPKAAEELHQPLLLAVWFGFRFDCLQAQPVRSALRATIGPRPDAAPRALTAGLFVSRSFFNRLDWHSHFSATSVRQSHRGTDEQPDQSRRVTDQERSSPPGAPDVAEDRRRRGGPVKDRCGVTGRQRRQPVSTDSLCVLLFWEKGFGEPLPLLPDRPPVLVSCVGEAGGTTTARKAATSTGAAVRQPTTKATAATPSNRFP